MSLLPEQHLSDEAVAAFADGALTGHARERARRHTADCAECNHAVAVQREAVWALRAAPAPALPSGLLDRLRDVPVSTPIRTVPTTVSSDGSAMFSTFGAAALVPPTRAPRSGQKNDSSGTTSSTNHLRPFALAVAAVAVVGALGAVASSNDDSDGTPRAHTVAVKPANHVGHGAPVRTREVDLLNAALPIGR